MRLFDIFLKIIEQFRLVDSEEFTQLKVDVKEWTSTATTESDDKIKSLYAKIHKGILLRLINPFIYFFMLKWVKDLVNGDNQDDDVIR